MSYRHTWLWTTGPLAYARGYKPGVDDPTIGRERMFVVAPRVSKGTIFHTARRSAW